MYIVKYHVKLVNKKYHLKSLFPQEITTLNTNIIPGKLVATGEIYNKPFNRSSAISIITI